MINGGSVTQEPPPPAQENSPDNSGAKRERIALRESDPGSLHCVYDKGRSYGVEVSCKSPRPSRSRQLGSGMGYDGVVAKPKTRLSTRIHPVTN
jgi:hypothetical protein